MLEEILDKLRNYLEEMDEDKLSEPNTLAVLRVVIVVGETKNVLLLPLSDFKVLYQVILMMEKINLIFESNFLSKIFL